jgi:hypothetical protein
MRTFDPARVAYFETENWVAYYQKRWRNRRRAAPEPVLATIHHWTEAACPACLALTAAQRLISPIALPAEPHTLG